MFSFSFSWQCGFALFATILIYCMKITHNSRYVSKLGIITGDLKLLFVAEPEKPPQSVTIATIDSSRIEVTWKPVPKDFQHGIITEYVILYNYSGEGKISEHKVLGNVSEVVVGGLKQSTEYTIRVLAATVKGRGPASSPKSATTKGKEAI